MISAQILGYDEVVKRLDALGPKLQAEARKSVVKLCLMLTAKVKAEKLSGQVLKVKTGQLRRSVTYKVIDSPTGPSGQVGTNVKYAPVHEFGYSGPVSVKAHLRSIKQAFGRPVDQKEISVKAHTRHVNYPERSFLRSALNEMQGDVSRELLDAVKRAIK